MKSLVRVLQLLLILIASFAALSLASYLPYYFSYDMDTIVLQDLMLLQSGQLPSHYVHPGLGMNLVLTWIQGLAQSFGFITNVSMATLAQASQPLVVIAEQISFLRQVNALFCVLLAALLWMAFDRAYKKDSVASVLSLVSFLIIPALWQYDILMLRTETYSLIFWAIAVIFLVLGLYEVDPDKTRRFIRFIGFFATLSFFTKIQSFFLIAVLPLLFLLLKSNDHKWVSEKIFPVKKFLYVFLAIGAISIVIKYPNYVTTFRSNWLPNKFFVLFVAILWLISLHQEKKITWKWIQNYVGLLEGFAEFFKIFLQGAAFVLIVPFFIPLNPLKSLVNAILYFKIIFLRLFEYSEISTNFLMGNLRTQTLHILILVCAGSAVAAFQYLKKDRSQKLILLVLIAVVMMGHLTLGARDKLQDAVWIQIPVLTILALVLMFVHHYWRWTIWFGVIIVHVYLLTGFKKYQIPQEIAYFDQVRAMSEVYQFNQWDELMNQKFPSELSVMEGLDFARSWSQWKSILANNFPQMSFTLNDVKPFGKNLRIDLKEADLKYMNTRDTVLSVYTPTTATDDFKEERCFKLKTDQIKINGAEFRVKYYGSEHLGYSIKWNFDDRHQVMGKEGTSAFLHSYKCVIKGESLKNSFVVLQPSLDFYKSQN